jgi:sugar/nucleoside kinase (ribokinase family)
MYDLCCIGHITSDKIVTPQSVTHLPGGTAFYFSSALSSLNLQYLLVTAVAEQEMHYVRRLEQTGIKVLCLPSAHTVCFENMYADDQDHRVQRVTRKADAFRIEQFEAVSSNIFHLGPLLADDIPTDMIAVLAAKAKISLDVQGYLRALDGEDVVAVDWKDKIATLASIHYLKASESEAEVLTGVVDVQESARILAGWGVKEVIITMGSKGSLVYSEGMFYSIPAFPPTHLKDATGCGDTYMAGYLYQRSKGKNCKEAGCFAAAMATIKIQNNGPFSGSEQEINDLLQQRSFN